MHKARFYAALKLGANQQPPIYLQYAIWALAALVSPKYESQGDIFYERAHRYADAAELMVCLSVRWMTSLLRDKGPAWNTIYYLRRSMLAPDSDI